MFSYDGFVFCFVVETLLVVVLWSSLFFRYHTEKIYDVGGALSRTSHFSSSRKSFFFVVLCASLLLLLWGNSLVHAYCTPSVFDRIRFGFRVNHILVINSARRERVF